MGRREKTQTNRARVYLMNIYISQLSTGMFSSLASQQMEVIVFPLPRRADISSIFLLTSISWWSRLPHRADKRCGATDTEERLQQYSDFLSIKTLNRVSRESVYKTRTTSPEALTCRYRSYGWRTYIHSTYEHFWECENWLNKIMKPGSVRLMNLEDVWVKHRDNELYIRHPKQNRSLRDVHKSVSTHFLKSWTCIFEDMDNTIQRISV